MEEFIENFNEFRAWLYNGCLPNVSGKQTLEDIQNKFEELGLKEVF